MDSIEGPEVTLKSLLSRSPYALTKEIEEDKILTNLDCRKKNNKNN